MLFKRFFTYKLMVKRINYYKGIYKRFGFQAILFLIESKFLRHRLSKRRLKGILHPIDLSNYTADVTTLFQIMFNNEYGIADKIDPSSIIDCGANIGLSAVWFANTFPNARIIAIEPDVNNFVYLQKNAKNYPNITCLNKAVWAYETSVSIIDKGTGNWSFQTQESKIKTKDDTIAISIPKVMDEFKIDYIDILKIDIEGAEKELFSKNYESWISNIGVIAIELHDNIDENISSLFYNAISKRTHKKYNNGENLICDFR